MAVTAVGAAAPGALPVATTEATTARVRVPCPSRLSIRTSRVRTARQTSRLGRETPRLARVRVRLAKTGRGLRPVAEATPVSVAPRGQEVSPPLSASPVAPAAGPIRS